MKRRFTILTAALALLTFLAVPMGMRGQTTVTYKLTIDASNFNTTSYAANNNEKTSNAVCITDNTKTYEVKWTSNQVMKSSDNMQWKTNQGKIYNSTDLGTITNVTVTSSAGTFTTYYGTSEQPSYGNAGDGKGYFKTSVGGATGYSSKLEVVFEIEESDPTPTYTITAQSNNNSYGSVSLSGTTITATPNSGYRVIAGNGGYTITAGTATVTNNGDNTFSVTPESDCTVQINFEAIPTYSITFNAGSGTCDTPTMSGYDGSTITLPTATPSQACVSRGWEFAGWATESVNETTTAPTTLLNNDYTINGDATLYAVYKVTEGDGGSFEYVFSEQGYANAQTVYSATMDVTSGIGWAATKGGSNEPKYYDTGSGLRVYNGGTFKVTANNNTITEVSLTFSGDGYTFTSDASNPTTWTGSQSTDITWNVSRTCRLQKVNVTYGTSITTYNSNPSCFPMVATPTFTPAAGTYTGAQNVTIECDTDGATIQYKTTEEGEWQNYSAAIPVSTTTTIWAKATNNGMDDSEVAEATYVIQYTLTVDIDDMVEYFLYDNSNETWDEITLDENGQALVPSGADIRISGGEVYDDCYEVESFDVTDGNDDPVTVVDNTDDDGTYSFIMPASNATLTATLNEIADHYTLTVEGTANVSFEMLVGSMSTITPLNANHQASICEASEVTISELTVGIGYVLESVAITYGGETVAVTTNEGGLYAFQMPSSNATLTFTVGEIPTYTYTLATSIESGKTYIIVNQESSKAMGLQNSNNRAAVEVVMDNNKITVSSDEVYEFVIASAGEGVYSIYDARTGGYLYAASGGNYLRTDAELDANGKWAISIDQDGKASIVTQVNNTNKVMQYNNNNKLFSCYGSASQKPVYLYVKDETYTLENITGYTGEKDHYFLIASPVTVDPATVSGMTTGDFDLYYFDQAEEDEWRNYEATAFNLVPGTGYLYAKKAANGNSTYSFELTGIPYAGDGTVHLVYNENAEFRGFNLIGNPFGTNANLDLPYYRLNSDGSALNTSTESTQVFVMEGVFVQATTSIRTATFSSAAKRVSQLNVKVTRNRSAVLDNAIIRFDNGAVLGKFQLNPNNTKLYITEGNQDYAVVRSNNAGEMPVSFKAAENGNYTLSIEAENVEASYLHLIDNMTGADVNLLATPSYSFEARTTDYANRFRLVFNTNGVEENNATANFAYFNGSSWTVNNMGEATLQVVDMMGRVISTESVSGNTEVNLNQAAGVYMLRLVNGNDVKVQKVVVR